ncbi:MAG: thioredoxin family protein [bacterium]|nr:thioredoxin family protein [bacterium]
MSRILSAIAVVALVASSAYAAPVKPGEKAPSFKGTDATTGKEVSSDDFKDAKATVVVFTCNRCPVAIAYEDRFIEFTKKFADKEVKFIAIDCNGDEREAMSQRAEEKGFNFPYLADASKQSALDFGATRTPELFVIDSKGVVQYTGAFDSDMKNPETNYVADAVNAVLEGKTPETQKTRAVGCGIPLRKSR